jgi:hypothetical protein
MPATAPPIRALLGFVAGALSVLIFHQGAWALLHAAGLLPAPYPIDPVPPWGVPLIVDFCFWAGLYGTVLGLLWPRLATPPWLTGLILGLVATLVFWFVVAPLKGQPVADGWVPRGMLVVLAILLPWGFGTAIILQMMLRRAQRRASG